MQAFERDGFASTSMRALAKEAGVSVGLAYRYFPAKEAIVLAFYEQTAEELARQPIEGFSLGARFHSVMREKYTLLRPHHRAMGSVMAAMLDPEGPVGVLSPATERLRGITQGVLREAVGGTPGVPDDLKEPLDEVIRDAVQPPGVDGGVDGGDPDGEIGGRHGGEVGGTGTELGGTAPTAFHHSDLETKRRVQPVYPKAAKSMNLGQQRCKALVKIDASGSPYDVQVEDCPVVFHAPTREALLKWRWYAPRDGRQKVAAQTVITITYTLR